MAIFEIKTKRTMVINGEIVDKGLSVQISTFQHNPFVEFKKIQNAFMRIHGLDLKFTGHLHMGDLEFKKIN
jgi:hypothetical protein